MRAGEGFIFGTPPPHPERGTRGECLAADVISVFVTSGFEVERGRLLGGRRLQYLGNARFAPINNPQEDEEKTRKPRGGVAKAAWGLHQSAD